MLWYTECKDEGEPAMKRTIDRQLQIFSGSHYPELAEKVAAQLGVKLGETNLQHFANGEIKCQLDKSVRGADVYIFQTHNGSVSEAIMEQAILIDAAKRASAKHITAVCPFFGYARQDRKSLGREPITAKLVVDILAVAGADRIVSVDLHSGQIQGFFNGPFDHLIAMPALANHLKNRFGKDFMMVSPDAGRVKLTERYSRRLDVELAIVHKRRTGKNESKALDVIGEVKGQNCVIIDDMIDTAGTMCAAAEVLKKHGAKSVSAIATHAILSPPAVERLRKSAIEHLAVTDTLPLPKDSKGLPIEVISVVNLIATAVEAIFKEQSVSAIFEGENQA
jgi:ribose-phosphate pyrophosphokinase